MKDMSIDIFYTDSRAREWYGEGKALIATLEEAYEGEDLVFPKEVRRGSIYEDANIQHVIVRAPDDMTAEELYEIELPRGLGVRIEELPM